MNKLRKQIISRLLYAEFALDDMCDELSKKRLCSSGLVDYANELQKLRESIEVELKRIRDENN